MVADKYDIPLAWETSVCFMKLYASVYGADELLESVHMFDDEFVKELLEKQITSISETNFAEEIVKTDIEASLKYQVYRHSWVFIYSEYQTQKRIVFKNVAKKYLVLQGKRFDIHDIENYKNEYDFYN